MQICAYDACVCMHARMHMCVNSVGCTTDWRTGYHRFALQRVQVQHHSNVEIDHELFFPHQCLSNYCTSKSNFEHQNYSCEEYDSDI